MKQLIRDALLDALPSGMAVFWGIAPRDKVPPMIQLHKVGGLDDFSIEARTGLRSAIVQVDCYGKTYKQATELSETVRTTLSGFREDVIYGMFCTGDQDLDPGSDVDDRIFRVRLDFDVQFRDA